MSDDEDYYYDDDDYIYIDEGPYADAVSRSRPSDAALSQL